MEAKPRAPVVPRASVEQPNMAVPAELPWLAFGGGSEPLSNQVSLAQDVGLFSSLMAGRGMVLFASGAGAQLAVARDVAPGPTRDVHARLARLLGSPDADLTDYQRATIPIDGPSTAEHVRNALARALSRGTSPLLVYGASHGSPGVTPRENSMSLWGGWPLTVEDVAELLDNAEGKRPTRFVVTSCFGGGFSELIFKTHEPERKKHAAKAEPAELLTKLADERRALRDDDHCGLFAAPADDEASGCDPNPDRRSQESYSIHFLHALGGRDRKEQDRSSAIDLNHDGKIGLLEAHTWARIESRSFDIPTTTSERYLRHAVQTEPATPTLDPLAAPEEVVVIKALGEELELDDEPSARQKLAELDDILQDVGAQLDEAQKGADDAYYALRIALLERYPLLDHPWEARTAALLRREGRAIASMLEDSELSAAHRDAERELGEAVLQHDTVRVARARVLRLVRAFETLRLASTLYKRGGVAKERYDRLRGCERWVPSLRRR